MIHITMKRIGEYLGRPNYLYGRDDIDEMVETTDSPLYTIAWWIGVVAIVPFSPTFDMDYAAWCFCYYDKQNANYCRDNQYLDFIWRSHNAGKIGNVHCTSCGHSHKDSEPCVEDDERFPQE